MIIAATLAWLLAANADLGIAAAIAASPKTWIPCCRGEAMSVGTRGTSRCRRLGPRPARCRPPLRRNDVGDIRLVHAAGSHGYGQGLAVDRQHLAAQRTGHPLDHARIVLLPRLLEQ